MTLYGIFFYLIAVVIIVSTTVAITRRNLVHAVVYLILSYFGTAMLFYLFGAPLLAALEVIIYAGAIMVLFLFVVMMIKVEEPKGTLFPINQWLPAALFGTVYLIVGIVMLFSTPGGGISLALLWATPREFALYVFQNHWFSVEVVSMLLLIALIGALRVGKSRRGRATEDGEI
jgi:NADH-quinone oxidoreductase subunit J